MIRNTYQTTMMNLQRIKFAPLNVPVERRLQTLAIAAAVSLMTLGGPITVIFCIYLILYTQLWWMSMLYVIWIFVIDRNSCEQDGRQIEWVRKLKWFNYIIAYFPINLVTLPSVDLDPKRNYLFCSFPHGLLAAGVVTSFVTDAAGCRDHFPHHTPHVCTLTYHFRVPFVRELLQALGFRSASATSINHLLAKPEGGNVVVLVVGGTAEAIRFIPGQYRLYLRSRKGFVKLALQNGSPLVPVFSFGEPDIYSKVKVEEGSILKMIDDKFMEWFGKACAIPNGRGIFQYSFGMLPYRRPINVIVGKPLDLEKIENPTEEQIDEVHQKFTKSIIDIFETQKQFYLKQHEHVHLEII